jgi:hypothetical protein
MYTSRASSATKSMSSLHPVHLPPECSKMRASATEERPNRIDRSCRYEHSFKTNSI